MKKAGRLQLRLDEELLETVKTIAQSRGLSLSYLVEQYLRELAREHQMHVEDDGVKQI